MSPLDAGADEMREAQIETLPQDLFMIVRLVALLRGMLSGLKARQPHTHN